MINSQCSGIYEKCLNIKITNACPGSCYFCIERYGYKPNMVPVTQIVEKANALKDYQTVLILGGEPFTYPHLSELLQGLRKKEIYITTNGGSFANTDIPSISKYITGLNVSIHSYDESENSSILKTKVDFHVLKEAIRCFQSYGVPVRFNTILLADGICSKEKIKRMLDFCREMQVSWIRFSELQFETKGFVFARIALMAFMPTPIMMDAIRTLRLTDSVLRFGNLAVLSMSVNRFRRMRVVEKTKPTVLSCIQTVKFSPVGSSPKGIESVIPNRVRK